MDFSAHLSRRFTALNPGKHAQFMPVHVSPDGHGAYLMTAGDREKRIFLNRPEAQSINHGKNNQNLDAQLRL